MRRVSRGSDRIRRGRQRGPGASVALIAWKRHSKVGVSVRLVDHHTLARAFVGRLPTSGRWGAVDRGGGAEQNQGPPAHRLIALTDKGGVTWPVPHMRLTETRSTRYS